MIENSFGVSLPSDAKLVLSRNGPFYYLWVTDGTGTNTIMNMITNVSVGPIVDDQPVHVGTQTLISKSGTSGASISGNLTETVTQTVLLAYDDTGLTTQDGTHTGFYVTFLVVRKTSQNLVTRGVKDTVKFQGVGNGIIRGQNVILQGTAGATVTGVLNPP